MSKILILSQFCSPEPDFKIIPVAKLLAADKHHVQVLTGFPNYPSGNLYDGYHKQGVRRDFIDDISVVRVPIFAYHGRSIVKRMLNYFSFALSAASVGAFKIDRPDIIYAYHAPGTIAIPAIVIKYIYKAKLFYDINDYWPDSLAATGMIQNKVILRIVNAYCRITYRYFDKINVVSKGFKTKLIKDNVNHQKISLIYNWPNEIGFVEDNKYRRYSSSKASRFTIMYTGNVGNAQELEVLIDVAKICSDSERLTNIHFVIVGEGTMLKELREKSQRVGMKNISFLGQVSSKEIGLFLESADVLFLHLRKEPIFEITIPSKLFSYLSVGKPVLSGVSGETNTLVTQANCGLVFESGNRAELFSCVNALASTSVARLKDYGSRGKEFYDSHLTKKILMKKFTDEILSTY